MPHLHLHLQVPKCSAPMRTRQKSGLYSPPVHEFCTPLLYPPPVPPFCTRVLYEGFVPYYRDIRWVLVRYCALRYMAAKIQLKIAGNETCKVKQHWESTGSPVVRGFCTPLLYPPSVRGFCTRVLYQGFVRGFCTRVQLGFCGRDAQRPIGKNFSQCLFGLSCQRTYTHTIRFCVF